jgi:hypothetical protein
MFIKQRFSIPQIICKNILEQLLGVLCVYNRRKVLKGKELDIYFEDFKLAFEYDSFYWHNDIITPKTDKEKNDLCKQNKITLIRIKEPALNQYRNVNVAIHEIKQQIITHLLIINEICQKNFSKNDILKININQNELLDNSYNIQFILKAASHCKTYAEFRRKHNRCYQFICRNKLYHLLNDLKTRDHRHMTKDEYFKYILSECSTYTDFLKHKTQPFAYKRKYNKEIKELFKKKKVT